ncbi:MAG: GNAT family N-acetyltransferase [Pyrinomonadaceae bacterium]
MQIREARAADAEALIEFNQAMALETEGKRLDADILRRGVAAVFRDSTKGFYVVAENSERIVGGLMVTFEWSDWRDAWFWWIQSVYVLPEARGEGVYRQLYEFVKAKSENEIVCGFRLYVERANSIAHKVYERLGMQPSTYLMYEESK